MSLTDTLHKFKFLRNLARKFAHKASVSQAFYSGKIYMNAVQHKWAYLNGMTLEKHDNELQQYIFALAKDYELFIDIGCNLGVMTLGTLLHNNSIKAVAVDPSKTAIKLLNRSVKANNLNNRCEVICAGVGNTDGFTHFNDNYGSAMSAISNTGDQITQLRFSTLLNRYNYQRTLVKIDTEGFETIILEDLANVKNLQSFTFILEVHPSGYHAGDPTKVFDMLMKNNAAIYDLDRAKVESLPGDEISQVLVEF